MAYPHLALRPSRNVLVSHYVVAGSKNPLPLGMGSVKIVKSMMTLRRDTVLKEAVHIALGNRTDGTKEILDYSIAPNESKTNWKDMIETIKVRGVERVALFCTDGLNGMEEVINSVYPSAKIQRCLLHVQRNISSKCRVSDRTEITEDFKSVYTSADKIVVLSDGEVKEQGTPAELMSRDGIFKKMSKLQKESLNWKINENKA